MRKEEMINAFTIKTLVLLIFAEVLLGYGLWKVAEGEEFSGRAYFTIFVYAVIPILAIVLGMAVAETYENVGVRAQGTWVFITGFVGTLAAGSAYYMGYLRSKNIDSQE